MTFGINPFGLGPYAQPIITADTEPTIAEIARLSTNVLRAYDSDTFSSYSTTIVQALRSSTNTPTINLSRSALQILISESFPPTYKVYEVTVSWWDGVNENTAHSDSWWDGSAEQDSKFRGWWGGDPPDQTLQ